jgi:hypothetical protein
MNLASKIPAIVFLCFWLFSGLYLGLGGISRVNVDEVNEQIEAKRNVLQKDTINYTFKKVKYTTLYDFELAIENQNLVDYFSWVNGLNKFSSLLLTAMSFGIIGAIISILIEIAFGGTSVENTAFITKPILGLLTGLVVLGISYILPTIVVKGNTEIRPISLMFICLFCGIYSNKFYDKLEATFEKTFIVKK